MTGKGNVISLSNSSKGLATIGVLSPFPLTPFPAHAGTGEKLLAGLRPALIGVMLLQSLCTDQVQGEALLSVGEAHKLIFPRPRQSGEGD